MLLRMAVDGTQHDVQYGKERMCERECNFDHKIRKVGMKIAFCGAKSL
jgi:hypothetical protein